MALVIVLVAVTLLSLATLAPLRNERQALQRERETELLFIGEQFRQALASYAAATPAGAARFPKSLADLLEDKRFPNVRRHLRRVYADPFTGAADWTLITQQGAIVGVASSSTRPPLKRSGFARADAAFAEASSYAEWRFDAQWVAGAVAPVVTASTPPGSANPVLPEPVEQAAPPAPSRDGGGGSECLRAYSAALNLCGKDPANMGACNTAARGTYMACLRG
jgi:type II secretory pathway pseudopilin PulG